MDHLKLRAPDQVPAHGRTLQQFKPWKNHLKNYLHLDTDNTLFFPGNFYATWRSQEDHDDRLHQLHAQDLEAARLRKRQNQQAAQLDCDLAELLERRNAQLAKFLSLITMLCHYTEQDQIDQHATSLDWIFTFLEQNRDNAALEEDERFSPTLENFIVRWALQFIDPRLPSQVHKIFVHQLKNNVRLIDIHQQVFKQIPELLQDIEVTENNRASVNTHN